MSDKEQRCRHVKNHETPPPFPEAGKGQKQDEWSKTEKVLSVIIREDVIAEQLKSKRGWTQNDSVLGHWGHITR